MREKIIRALKDNKKLLLVVILVFTSGIIVGFSISFSISAIDSSRPKKYYIAIDDIEIRGGTDPFDSNVKIAYDGSTVPIGGGEGFLMRFDLINKPKRWSKCEISLYEHSKSGGVNSYVYLFEGNWTEEEWDGYGNYMGDIEIYWKIEDSVGMITNVYSELGFKFVDISDYIGNIATPTFSIAVMGRLPGDWIVRFYSSEWNNTEHMLPFILPSYDSYKNYLPQLIWS